MGGELLVTRTKTLCIAIVALTGIIWVGYSMMNNFNGYCGRENRYLVKEEVFQKVVEQSILKVSTHKWLNHLIASRLEPASVIPYKNFEDFASVNPDCCDYYSYVMDMKLDKVRKYDALSDTQDVPLHYKLLGWAWRSVLVEHKLRFVDVKGEAKTKWFGDVSWVDTCGNRVLPPLEYIVG